MKHSHFLYCIAALLLITSCTTAKRKEQTISISGAFALYPLAVQWAEAYKAEHPEIRFNISAGGAGKGMADALSGTVDLGMFSREIAIEEINQGAWWVGLTIDAVVPTISDKNPLLGLIKKRGLSRDDFRSVFIEGSANDWGVLLDTNVILPVEVYTRSDACGAAGTWAKYLGARQENLIGIGIYGDPGLAEAVSIDPAGIGFNNTIFVYDIKTADKRPGIEVIPIDLNANGIIEAAEDFYGSFDDMLAAIAGGQYPSPPARELYFVSKGKPEKQATLNFIEWILTSGQSYIKPAGYVPLEQSKIDGYLNKIR